MELSSSNIKKIVIFSQRKLFLYFLKRKLFLYFQERNPALFSPSLKNKKQFTQRKFLILQGTETPKKCLVFSQKKTSIIFLETETPKIFLIFPSFYTIKSD